MRRWGRDHVVEAMRAREARAPVRSA